MKSSAMTLVTFGLLAAFAGCSQSPPAVAPSAIQDGDADAAARRMGLVGVTQTELFDEKYRRAIAAAAEELVRMGESPRDFFAKVVPGDEKTGELWPVDVPSGRQPNPQPVFAAGAEPRSDLLVVSLWSRGSLIAANQNVQGNGDGKSRNMHFDIKAGRITATLFWQ